MAVFYICPFRPILFWLSRAGCPVLAVLLPRLSYPIRPVLAALSGNYFHGSPVSAVLFGQSGPASPLPVPFCLSFSACPIMAVPFWLSFPFCPIPALLT
jgi:hypothetical protein